ncbi:MAG: ATP-binding protein [Bacteroidota bacterium]|nr:ATP-binding protein [Bacteroidota bacterium]
MAQRLSAEAIDDLRKELDRIERDIDTPPLELCRSLDDILRTSYILATEDELQTFASFIARQLYVHQALRVPPLLAEAMESLRGWLHAILRERIEYPREQLLPAIKALSYWLDWHENPARFDEGLVSFPHKRHSSLENLVEGCIRFIITERQSIRGSTGEEIPVLGGIDATTENRLSLQLHGRWRALAQHVRTGTILAIVGASSVSPGILACSDNTLVTIEPDFLLDVTTVAECFSGSVNSPLFALWRLLKPQQINATAIVGTVINACFDELLVQPELDTAAAINRALRACYLDVLAALKSKALTLESLEQSVRAQLATIKTVVASLAGRTTTEPTFLAPWYGIQGRLDVLIEHPEDASCKSIIELKTGTPPANQFLATSTGKHIALAMRPSHAMQIAGYNLLLDAAFPHRHGTSSILYSQSADQPLRNAPNDHELKADFLGMRNRIIELYWALAHRRFRALEQLITFCENFSIPLHQDELLAWKQQWQQLTLQEKLYVQAWLAFAFHELITGHIGNARRQSGFASLWRMSIAEKTEQLSALTHLCYDPAASDLERGYICFRFTDRTPQVHPFRRGDIGIVYPHAALDQHGAVLGQVFKCAIRALTADRVTVSLRNKLFDRRQFEQYSYWALDMDMLSLGIESLVRGCGDFVRLPSSQRQRILGTIPPQTTNLEVPRPERLTDTQYDLLCKALCSCDYFLLEGPPGTGKTSTMLRAIVEHLLTTTDETILCTALTNRAVDEICTALQHITSGGTLLRLGSTDTTDHPDITLGTMAQHMDFDQLASVLDRARVVVATVPYLNANTALFELKHFTTAIIDEASQLLEPAVLSIVSRVRRFIMIGDACQLPAVVQQDDRFCSVSHDQLEAIELHRLDTSLFERLLRLAKRNRWDYAWGRLVEQGRMHRLIAAFPARVFYGTTFRTIHPWQEDPSPTVPYADLPRFLQHRLVFIDTPSEAHTGYNHTEAHLAAACATALAAVATQPLDRAIGIITPFRKQIRTILEYLPETLAPFLTIDTVERFQGSERDHIILSCSVNAWHEIPLIESQVVLDGRTVDRKLNVALTRARHQLIVIGNRAILERRHSYAALIEEISRNGIVISAEDARMQLELHAIFSARSNHHAHHRN